MTMMIGWSDLKMRRISTRSIVTLFFLAKDKKMLVKCQWLLLWSQWVARRESQRLMRSKRRRKSRREVAAADSGRGKEGLDGIKRLWTLGEVELIRKIRGW